MIILEKKKVWTKREKKREKRKKWIWEEKTASQYNHIIEFVQFDLRQKCRCLATGRHRLCHRDLITFKPQLKLIVSDIIPINRRSISVSSVLICHRLWSIPVRVSILSPRSSLNFNSHSSFNPHQPITLSNHCQVVSLDHQLQRLFSFQSFKSTTSQV